jgi:hypothetical protein
VACDRGASTAASVGEDLVNAWEAGGGTGYWYRDDTTFKADLAKLTK